MLSSVADTKKSAVDNSISFQTDPNTNWSADYVRLGGSKTFSYVDGWLPKQISEKSEKAKQIAAAAVEVIEVSTLNLSQAVALANLQEHERTGKQLLMIAYGVAGTGKSHLIKCLKQECDGVYVMAPTAMAAMLVGGVTYQSAIPVPVNGCRTFKSMSAEVRERYKQLLRWVKTLVIDEFSMLSQDAVGWIDLRLRQIFEVPEY